MALTDKLLSWVLRRGPIAQPPTPGGLSFSAWKHALDTQVRPLFAGDTFAQAVASGAVADRLAFAFAGGYQAALRYVRMASSMMVCASSPSW